MLPAPGQFVEAARQGWAEQHRAREQREKKRQDRHTAGDQDREQHHHRIDQADKDKVAALGLEILPTLSQRNPQIFKPDLANFIIFPAGYQISRMRDRHGRSPFSGHHDGRSSFLPSVGTGDGGGLLTCAAHRLGMRNASWPVAADYTKASCTGTKKQLAPSAADVPSRQLY